MDPLPQYLLAMTPAVPMLAIALIGIIIGINRRKSQPKASRLVIWGLTALVANVIGSSAIRVYANRSFDKYQDATVFGQHLAQMHLILYVLKILGFALVTAAVFADRSRERVDRLTISSSDRGARLGWAKEEIDD
jgi:hypothetical protein